MTERGSMTEHLSFDGRPVPVAPGQTVAGALWAAGIRSWRTTRRREQPRGLFCGIGACFDCLATVDGTPAQRLCLTPAHPGMEVVRKVPFLTHSAVAGPLLNTPAGGGVGGGGGYDVVVVGGGPAGLGAAAAAALGGARVALLDAGARLGGQFWRHRDGETGAHGYRDWAVFEGLRSIVEERVDHIPEASVWFAEPAVPSRDTVVLHTTAGRFQAPKVVLATGAYDRALPFPGWDLPGVVTPGAAQALLKGSGVPIGQAVVVAGAGPFLLPVAAGLLDAGVRVVAVLEAGNPRGYAARPRVLAGVAGKLGEAAGYAATLARHRVPYKARHAVTAAHAGPDGTVSSVDIVHLARPRLRQRIACDAVAVGYGFTANLELALLLGCRTRVGADGGLAVAVGADGRTSVPGVYAAGEITGVGGSALAVLEGELAGGAAAGDPLSTRDISRAIRQRHRLRAFADLMHAAHAMPAGWPSWLDGETLVCRCEEVPYQAVTGAVTELGATTSRAVKSLARPGMGWCQGRVCGAATATLTARACGRPVTEEDLLAFAHRPLATPVRLADLADLAGAGPADPAGL
jgi:D-hydroxyproline dehydrogenase subunit alpha